MLWRMLMSQPILAKESQCSELSAIVLAIIKCCWLSTKILKTEDNLTLMFRNIFSLWALWCDKILVSDYCPLTITFWYFNFNYEKHIFPLLLPHPFRYPSTHFFNLMASLFTNYYCMHICICIHLYIPKHNLLIPYKLFVCMFSGLIIWHWTNLR